MSVETLEMSQPNAALSPFVFAFIHRDETVCGQVVRVLPELRCSIQIQTRDPYWLRDRDESATWTRTPRFAVWAPRIAWSYGFVQRRVKAFAIGLTPAGFRAVTRTATAPLLGRVTALESFSTLSAAAIDPGPAETFEDWVARIHAPLRAFFAGAQPERRFDGALEILATGEGGVIARAAHESGLSERQFRRVFTEHFGIAPKLYQRALRVDRMIRQLHPAPWEQDAHADAPLAFADQPHAIREFGEMTGVTPSDYALLKLGGDRTLRSFAIEGIAPPSGP